MSHKALFSRALTLAPERLHFAAHSHHLWPDASFEAQTQAWIDANVSRSTRSGIITPYTSFLVQEKDIFSTQGREEIISDFEEEMAAAAADPCADAE